MKTVCPSCGAVHSMEALSNDAAMRQAVNVLRTLPQPVEDLALEYVALFRPQAAAGNRAHGRGLAWKKAGRLLSELRDLVASGYAQWDRRPARPCPPAIWAAAMEKMVHFPPRELPLDSHGYLRKVAYGMADQADRQAETQQVQAERSGERRASRSNTEDIQGVGEILDRSWMKQVRTRNMSRK